MSPLDLKVPLKYPQTHVVLPSPLCPVRPVSEHTNQKYCPPEGKEQKSTAHFSWFLSVIRLRWAGFPLSPAPSGVSLRSSVLNPKPHGTSSWATSRILSPDINILILPNGHMKFFFSIVKILKETVLDEDAHIP